MAHNFMIRDDCLKRLRMLCDGDHWKTAFALGSACQMLDLDHLNELVEIVDEWSGNVDGALSLPDAKP